MKVTQEIIATIDGKNVENILLLITTMFKLDC